MTTTEIAQRAETFLEVAKSFEIVTDDHLNDAAIRLKNIKGAEQRVKDHFEDMRQTTYDAYQVVLGNIRLYSNPQQEPQTDYKKKIGDYSIKKEEERRKEAARLQEETRKKEEDRRLEVAEKTGNEKILDMPIFIPEVKVESTPKIKGISYTENWTYEVLNEAEVTDEYKMIDHQKLDQLAKAQKGNAKVPGIRFYSERRVRAGRI